MAKGKYWNGSEWEVLGTDADKISIADTGTLYDATNVETALAEAMGDINTHKADGAQHSKTARFVVGTSTAGWTSADCDYLCDGTEDQVEINAAITALPATGGEIVILDGTYNITAKINVNKNNINIRGNDNATILKRMYNSSTEEGVITLTGRSGCKIANLQIDGNKASYNNSNNSGIYLVSSNRNTITGNTCYNNNYGISLYTSSSNNTITGNTCYNNNDGIFLGASSSNTITGNACNNNDSGIYLFNSNDNTVTGNTCNNNFSGIVLAYGNNTITGNICNNNILSGIFLNSSSNNTITGNTCNNNGFGISLNVSSSNNNTITGNTCIRGTGLTTDYTESQHTIQLEGTRNNYNLVSSNNCMGKAVTVGGGTGNTLVNNKFDDSDDIQALNELVSTKASFKNGTSTFPSGTTHTVTDAFITASTLVTVIPTAEKQGVWVVNSAAGSFTITSDTAEPTAVTFDWGATK